MTLLHSRFIVRGTALGGMLLLAAAISAQTVPAGWKPIADKKARCTIALPPGWTTDKIMPSMATAPDRKASFTMGSKEPGTDFAMIVSMAKQMFKPAKTFEESATKIWFASAPDPQGKSSWYYAIGGKQICEVQVEFKDAAFEATAKQIVQSLGVAK